MITTSIDVIDGLVNGAVGTLKLCERGVSGQDANEDEEAMEVDDEVEEAAAPTPVLPRRLWLQFDVPTTGKLTRLRSKQAVNEAKRNGYDVESTWIPLEPRSLTLTIDCKSGVACKRRSSP